MTILTMLSYLSTINNCLILEEFFLFKSTSCSTTEVLKEFYYLLNFCLTKYLIMALIIKASLTCTIMIIAFCCFNLQIRKVNNTSVLKNTSKEENVHLEGPSLHHNLGTSMQTSAIIASPDTSGCHTLSIQALYLIW